MDLEPLGKLRYAGVGKQLLWVLDVVRSSRPLDEDELVERFTPAALRLVPPDVLGDPLREVHETLGTFNIRHVKSGSDIDAVVQVTTEAGEVWDVSCTVEEAPPHLIDRLLFAPSDPEDDHGGYIILLNGTSSAGKSTIAQHLQTLMDDRAWLHVQIDAFRQMLPKGKRHGLRRFYAGTRQAIAQLARAGNAVILDDVIEQRTWFEEILGVFEGIPVLYVGVRAPLDVVQQREKDRGDRQVGLARWQYNIVHSHGPYDLEVDTSVMSPTECTQAIQERIARGPGTAFDQIRGAAR